MAVSKARSFEISTDEPEALGGKDSAVDPMVLLLASLGSCLTIGWVTHARKRGIDYKNLKITVKAPFDLHGYLGMDKRVRPGFSEINYDVEVESDADEATLEEIKREAEKGSPVFDNIFNTTQVNGQILQKNLTR